MTRSGWNSFGSWHGIVSIYKKSWQFEHFLVANTNCMHVDDGTSWTKPNVHIFIYNANNSKKTAISTFLRAKNIINACIMYVVYSVIDGWLQLTGFQKKMTDVYRDVNSCSWAKTPHFAVRWGHMVLSFSSERTNKTAIFSVQITFYRRKV
jgi:hypothetical protein